MSAASRPPRRTDPTPAVVALLNRALLDAVPVRKPQHLGKVTRGSFARAVHPA
jgi:hypothetical protein